MDNITEQLKIWWKQPFKSDGSVLNWFLFLGLIIIVLFFWNRVLARIV